MGLISCLCSVAQWLLKNSLGEPCWLRALHPRALPPQQACTHLLTGATGVNVSQLSLNPNGTKLFDMSQLGFLLQMS